MRAVNKVIWTMFLVTFFFLPTTTASAQTQIEAEEFSSALEEIGREVGRLRMNLLQMSLGLSQPDESNAAFLHDITSTVDATMKTVSLLAGIYAEMVHPKDQAVVKKILVIYAKGAIKQSDSAVNTINKKLAGLKSPAAISEARGLRDTIQRGRDLIQRAVPGT